MQSFQDYVASKENLEEGVIGNVASGLASAGKQIWSGLKTGAQQFGNAVAGPQVKFDGAISSLTALITTIQKNPQLHGFKGIGDQPLIQELQGLLQALNQQRTQIPQLMGQAAQNNWQQPPQNIPMPQRAVA